jgi:glucose/arabinose dehydrogenase
VKTRSPSQSVALGMLAMLVASCGGSGDSSVAVPAAPAPTPTPIPTPTPTPTPAPIVAGLDERPNNSSCVAWARPTGTDSITVPEVFTGLPNFLSPVGLLQAPSDNARWFVIEQGGRVLTFANQSSVAVATPFIDITSRVRATGEMGLLGMAFHPGFPTDPRVFLSYTTGTSPLLSRISVFTTPDGGLTLDPNSERVLLTVNQPETNHNGGQVAFGPDGFLYIGLGDGGGGGDNHGTIGNGQLGSTLLGKMLRIDVGGPAALTYSIPGTNPSATNAQCGNGGTGPQSCPEIYASGFRNPWRWSFDRDTGELWVADVGQSAWEEVNLVELGGNYGWRLREGAHCFNPASNCPTAGLTDPVAEYDHGLGSSITGGYAYRGSQPTNLRGRFLFGDFTSGRIWAWLPENAAQPRQPTQLADTSLNIAAFGEGNDGELYVVNYAGSLHRIVFQPAGVGGIVPAVLSATGCVDSAAPGQAAAGMIPYTVNAPFWADAATKERFIGLPNGQNISVGADHDWQLPSGAVLMKHFRIGARLIETRLLMRHPDGVWGGYTYEWNSQQTDATRVQGGAVRDLGGGQQWIFPGESQCLQCHTSAAGRSLGLETAQLNRTFTYASTGRNAEQITTLNAINTLSPPITADPATLPALVDPADTAESLGNRARSYLHTNCSQCHRPGGPTPSSMDLRFTTALPPLGSNRVDTAGVALISEWINSLTGC